MLLLLLVVALVFWFRSLLAAFYTVFGQKCLPKMLFLWLPLARLPLLLLLLLLTNQTLQALLLSFLGLVFFDCSLLSHITGTIHRQKQQQQQRRQLTSQLSSAVFVPLFPAFALFFPGSSIHRLRRRCRSVIRLLSSEKASSPLLWSFSLLLLHRLCHRHTFQCVYVCVCCLIAGQISSQLFFFPSFSSPNDDRLFADCCFFLFGDGGWLPLMTNRYCCSFSFFFWFCVWFSEACIIDRQRAGEGEGSAKSISPTLWLAATVTLSLSPISDTATFALGLSLCLSVCLICVLSILSFFFSFFFSFDHSSFTAAFWISFRKNSAAAAFSIVLRQWGALLGQ